MNNYVCVTCGTQYAPAPVPPEVCPVCDDDRQHVGYDGQQWTTHETLVATLHNRIEHDGDLLGMESLNASLSRNELSCSAPTPGTSCGTA
jgi:hypothetical protein